MLNHFICEYADCFINQHVLLLRRSSSLNTLLQASNLILETLMQSPQCEVHPILNLITKYLEVEKHLNTLNDPRLIFFLKAVLELLDYLVI